MKLIACFASVIAQLATATLGPAGCSTESTTVATPARSHRRLASSRFLQVVLHGIETRDRTAYLFSPALSDVSKSFACIADSILCGSVLVKQRKKLAAERFSRWDGWHAIEQRLVRGRRDSVSDDIDDGGSSWRYRAVFVRTVDHQRVMKGCFASFQFDSDGVLESFPLVGRKRFLDGVHVAGKTGDRQ